jgi:hypothetical protein
MVRGFAAGGGGRALFNFYRPFEPFHRFQLFCHVACDVAPLFDEVAKEQRNRPRPFRLYELIDGQPQPLCDEVEKDKTGRGNGDHPG